MNKRNSHIQCWKLYQFLLYFAQRQYLIYQFRPVIWAWLPSILPQYFYFTEISHLIGKKKKKESDHYFSDELGIFKCNVEAEGFWVSPAQALTVEEGHCSLLCSESLFHSSPPARAAPAQSQVFAGCFPHLVTSSVLVTGSVVHRDSVIQKGDSTEKTSWGNRWGCSPVKADQTIKAGYRATTALLSRLSSRTESEDKPKANLVRAPKYLCVERETEIPRVLHSKTWFQPEAGKETHLCPPVCLSPCNNLKKMLQLLLLQTHGVSWRWTAPWLSAMQNKPQLYLPREHLRDAKGMVLQLPKPFQEDFLHIQNTYWLLQPWLAFSWVCTSSGYSQLLKACKTLGLINLQLHWAGDSYSLLTEI